MSLKSLGIAVALLACAVSAGTWVDPAVLDACSGYKASKVITQGAELTADLVLAGTGCNVFGPDIGKLKLQVVYETGEQDFNC